METPSQPPVGNVPRPDRTGRRRRWGSGRGPRPFRRKRTILIVTGEASGDMYGAELARKLWRIDRSLKIAGMGGDRMQKAGVRIVFDNRRLGVMGFVEVIRKWKTVREAQETVCAELKKGPVDLVVLIDSPDFNFRVAAAAKAAGIPIVYYVGPKVWAWRPGRIDSMAKWADKILVILPFEEALYREKGISCKFVGHPLLDEVPQDLDPVYLRQQFGLESGNYVVALLPGSRPQEIERLLPVLLSSARKLIGKIPRTSFLLPVAPSVDWKEIEERVRRSGVPVKLIAGDAPRVLACSDAAVVASGTATLEAALAGTPMVIVYKMAWLTYLLARLLVRVRHIGLVNIMAGREVAPELLQWNARAGKISRTLHRLLTDWETRKPMKRAMADVSVQLGTPGASARAAREVLKVLYRGRRGAGESSPAEPEAAAGPVREGG